MPASLVSPPESSHARAGPPQAMLGAGGDDWGTVDELCCAENVDGDLISTVVSFEFHSKREFRQELGGLVRLAQQFVGSTR